MSLLLTLVVSCNKPEPEPVVEPLPFAISDTLSRIDSLMQHDADSALIMLMSFRPTEGSGEISYKFNDNYQSLLLAEALYKTDNPQYYRDSLQTAMRYFDSLAQLYSHNDDIIMFSARSHYMSGVGYYELDSIVRACKEYLKTLEIMENHFYVDKLTGYKAKFMALTYTRLKELFTNQFMIKQAIYCGKVSLIFYKKATPSKYSISNTLAKLGQLYDISGRMDSAYYYYDEAMKSLPDSNNLFYRDLISSKAVLSYELGNGFIPALKQLGQVINLAESEDELLTRYYTIGSLYFEEKIYDSAVIYLNLVYDKERNSGNSGIKKLQAAEYLREIYRNQGDTITANRFSNILADNTMKEYNQKAKMSNVNELYQQHLKHQENKKFQREKHIAKKRTALTTIPIALLLVVTVFIVMRKLGKKHIAQHKEALERTENSLSEIKMKVEVKQFTDEQICQTILDIVKEQQFKSKIDYINYKDYALGNEQLIELRAAVNLHYDNFTIRLKDKFPELTNDDIDYCCLYLLGLKDADVSALMQKEYSTIRYRRNKIQTILKTDKNLTEVLYNLTQLSHTTN